MDLIKVNCPVCADWESQEVIRTPDYELTEEINFIVSQCLNCGFIYTSIRPDYQTLFSKYYPENYLCYHSQKSRLAANIDNIRIEQQALQRCGLISKFLLHFNQVKLLEIGCATGELLKVGRQKYNWEVWGVEPNKKLTTDSQEQGYRVIESTFELAKLPENYFNAICLFNVLEHLWDPVVSLRKINQLLKVSGLVIMEIPNFDSPSRNIFGRYWFLYHLPRHLSHFSRQSLTKLMNDCGFEKKFIIKQFRPTINAISFRYFIQNKVKSKFIRSFCTENNPLILGLSVIYEIIHNLFGQANTITAIFEKTNDLPNQPSLLTEKVL